MLSGKQGDPWVEGPYIGGGNAMIPVGTKKQFKQRSRWSKSVFWWLPGHTLQTGPRNTPKLCSGGFLDPRFGLGSEMLKKPYVQQILCSTNPIFNKPYVQQTLCSTNPMFNKPSVQQTLCSTNLMFNKPYVQQTLCSTNPMFSKPYVQQTLRSPNPMFNKPYVQQGPPGL